jgi:hypothetical protein
MLEIRLWGAAVSLGTVPSFAAPFKAFDTDGNGKISKREFQSALRDLKVGLVLRGVWQSSTMEACLLFPWLLCVRLRPRSN